jgi:hypothetical protein
VSLLDLVENKPKMMSVKLADYDEGGNNKVLGIARSHARITCMLCSLVSDI